VAKPENNNPVPPAPSATVIVLRETAAGLHVLLLRRNPALAFHGGDWVFPGGRIDPEDIAETPLDSARNAAVREVAEETGLQVSASDLLHYSHWVTPVSFPKRFAAQFFVMRWRGDAPVQVDNDEIVDSIWLSPKAALARQGEPGFTLPPPTWTSLTELSDCADFNDVKTFLAKREPPDYRPLILPCKGGAVCLYAGDAGFESADADAAGPRHRLWMRGADWDYENRE